MMARNVLFEAKKIEVLIIPTVAYEGQMALEAVTILTSLAFN